MRKEAGLRAQAELSVSLPGPTVKVTTRCHGHLVMVITKDMDEKVVDSNHGLVHNLSLPLQKAEDSNKLKFTW